MPRRRDDDRPDLWSAYNRVQENLTQGGLHERTATGRRHSTRPLQGIDQNVKINRALWMLAEGMKRRKAGPAESGGGLIAPSTMKAHSTAEGGHASQAAARPSVPSLRAAAAGATRPPRWRRGLPRPAKGN